MYCLLQCLVPSTMAMYDFMKVCPEVFNMTNFSIDYGTEKRLLINNGVVTYSNQQREILGQFNYDIFYDIKSLVFLKQPKTNQIK